jgi:phosphoribosylaminoimidazole carboxylase PurE protein
MNSKNFQVSILLGSESDLETMRSCQDVLNEFGVSNDLKILSAHRTPDPLADYISISEKNGVQVFIAAAGLAAHLAGAVAARTTKPVIGVPLDASSLGGLDSLLSTVQMPGGVPVATVAIGKAGAKNAGFLAVQILALKDGELAKKIKEYREKTAEKLLAKNKDFH